MIEFLGIITAGCLLIGLALALLVIVSKFFVVLQSKRRKTNER
jgi:hypothetical protein